MTLPPHPGGKTLIDLLPDVAAHGYGIIQICHFHLASRDTGYLDELRSELERNGITLEMLLIDAGDPMAADIAPHLAWFHEWLEIAERLGAQRARLCAGRSTPNRERLQASGKHLAELATDHPAVRLVTENWLEGTPDAASVSAVLEAADDRIGLLIDLANWSAPDKYRELEQIAPFAESCHAKCHFTVDGPNETDFRQTLAILKTAGYTGPISLIYDGPEPDEWRHLDHEWQMVQDVFTSI